MAEFNTSITMRGTTDELVALLKVLYRYSDEMKARYNEKHDCAFLE